MHLCFLSVLHLQMYHIVHRDDEPTAHSFTHLSHFNKAVQTITTKTILTCFWLWLFMHHITYLHPPTLFWYLRKEPCFFRGQITLTIITWWRTLRARSVKRSTLNFLTLMTAPSGLSQYTAFSPWLTVWVHLYTQNSKVQVWKYTNGDTAI